MKTIIIGAGAAGLMAAGTVKSDEILVLERNEKAGKKIYITGKGRCNVTNLCSPNEFLENIVTNPKFMTGAIYKLTPQDVIDLFSSLGLSTKTERGNRVFPESDKASDVTKALTVYAKNNGAQIVYNTLVTDVIKTVNGFCVKTTNGEYACDKLIIATGGKSYPVTGSDGSLYPIIEKLGHEIIPPVPSLIPLILQDKISELAGLTLKNVRATVSGKGLLKSEQGEMLFTHNGVSGPIILTLSSQINRINANGLTLSIDLKPALDYEKLDKRILRDFEEQKNKQLKNSLDALMPKALIPLVIAQADLKDFYQINSITKAQRDSLAGAIKNLSFRVESLGKIEHAIITSGGVNVNQINPKTMESKLIRGLFFAGEILDVDAFTGGFNMQTAFSTGYAAAHGASENI